MQPMTRLSRKELIELIEATEAAGNDATELRNFLAQLPEEGRPRQPARQGGGRLLLEEEETIEERLNNRVGDLFPNGIPLQEIFDYDYRFTKDELIEQCRKAGLGVSGDKTELAAKLIAHNKGVL